MKKMIWSGSLEEMVVASFTYKKHRYEWNDIDCVYYDETEGDESYLMEVPEGADIDEEEEETMTRKERLYSMKKEDLLKEASNLGLKVAKKTRNNDIVAMILAAEKTEEETMNTENTAEAIQHDAAEILGEEPEAIPTEEKIDLDDPMQTQYLDLEAEKITVEKPEKPEKKERKPRQKKTFESLLASVPVILGGVSISTNGKKRNAVHLNTENGKHRIFGYDGAVVVVTNEKYLHGVTEVTAEKRNYGWRVAPTAENMMAIQRNYKAALASK